MSGQREVVEQKRREGEINEATVEIKEEIKKSTEANLFIQTPGAIKFIETASDNAIAELTTILNLLEKPEADLREYVSQVAKLRATISMLNKFRTETIKKESLEETLKQILKDYE
tara:strand:+ start:1041 stop:1385 length:345 start_codon:yes stop_codon:yes gene_type:complete